jgi:hypothetical protein
MRLDSGGFTDLLKAFGALPEDEKQAAIALAEAECGHMRFVPNPGPQTDAYYSEADELFFGGGGGGGKALHLATPIPTPNGWTTMGQVRVGSYVYDKDGRPTKVVATSPVMFGRPCYRLTFDDGHTVVADADHQWATFTARERIAVLRLTDEWRGKRRVSRKRRAGQGVRLRPDVAAKNATKVHTYKAEPVPAVRTTQEIASSIIHGKVVNHSVDVCPGIEGVDKSLLVPAYTLGAWLGDGHSTDASITSMDAEILAEIGKDGFVLEMDASASKSTGLAKTYRIRHLGQAVQYAGWQSSSSPASLATHLKLLGVWGNKHIPQRYLRASKEARLLLLQGLMDTDGHADKRGKCEFTSTNEELARGVKELLLSLGVKAIVTEGRATLYGRDCGPKYRIIFTPKIPVFRLRRKAERLRLRDKQRDTQVRRYIVAVEQVASVPVKCIEVEAASHQFLCGEGMIPTHNSSLLCGLPLNEHQDIQLFRRESTQLRGLIKELTAMIGNTDGLNAQIGVWKIDGKVIELAGVKDENDKFKWQGRASDFKGFDEITHFTRSIYRFIIGWNRSTRPGQRCRVVVTGNPPMSVDGLWVIDHWAAWLDPTHPDPALPGELRWPVRRDDDTDDHEIFFRSKEEALAHLETLRSAPRDLDGNIIPPRSRSFIPARLEDNPDLMRAGYSAVVEAMPKEIRDAMRGKFNASLADQPMQLIPTAWIIAAQDRWRPDGARAQPMSAMGFDPAGGGRDSAVLAARHGGWYAPMISEAGTQTADGSWSAALIVKHRRDNAPVVVDAGGGAGHGFGGTTIMRLKDNFGSEDARTGVRPYNGAGESTTRSADGQFKFYNKRAEAFWQFREALDPDQPGGSPIALPPDSELRADLAAPTFEVGPRGIQVESKEDIKKRLGRSPGKGDAVVMAWSSGAREMRSAARAARSTAQLQQSARPPGRYDIRSNRGYGSEPSERSREHG